MSAADGARLGVMGGTFDPIHHGHLVAASEVGHAFALDEVVFVPTGRREEKDAASRAEDRYLMTVIATASNPRFSVSRVDIDRPGVTYTIDTLRELHAARPDAELFFITGADALARIMSWRDVDELFSLAHFVGCTRPGHRLTVTGLPDGKVSLIEIPALTISSTACRARVALGEPIWYRAIHRQTRAVRQPEAKPRGRESLERQASQPIASIFQNPGSLGLLPERF
jgi:nicotinate-nucleotide adenylyltransferase